MRRTGQPATMVAIEVMSLWPQSVGPRAVTVREADLWPVFALVIGERRDLLHTSAKALFGLLDGLRHAEEAVVVSGRCRWAVVDSENALLRLTLQAESPVVFETDILVPAERVLGLLDTVARGTTIGLTTRRHARGLTGRVDVGHVARHMVLVHCRPSPDLAELADELCWARQGTPSSS